jgi:hypothetical protein
MLLIYFLILIFIFLFLLCAVGWQVPESSKGVLGCWQRTSQFVTDAFVQDPCIRLDSDRSQAGVHSSISGLGGSDEPTPHFVIRSTGDQIDDRNEWIIEGRHLPAGTKSILRTLPHALRVLRAVPPIRSGHEPPGIAEAAMFVIEDERHAEPQGEYSSFEQAIAELKRRANIPWDQDPNRAPCTSWLTCGRTYEVIEYDDSHSPWKELRRVAMLEVSASGVKWSGGFEDPV